MTTTKLLTIENQKRFKISINDVCYNGWCKFIHNTTIELDHRAEGIRLIVDGTLQPIIWKVYELEVRNLKLNNGGYCPLDRRFIFYIFGTDGRRYANLYLIPQADGGFRIGTRKDFGLRYQFNLLSHKKRKAYQAAYRIRFGTRKRRRIEARDAEREEAREYRLAEMEWARRLIDT
jgi:hypothetical protein